GIRHRVRRRPSRSLRSVVPRYPVGNRLPSGMRPDRGSSTQRAQTAPLTVPTPGGTMIRPGLCSVTFRGLEVDRVVDLAADAALACIEWAGDAHVPPGDTVAAERARACT